MRKLKPGWPRPTTDEVLKRLRELERRLEAEGDYASSVALFTARQMIMESRLGERDQMGNRTS